MNNVESKNLGSILRRIIAMALVLSLVVIPVQFPGLSSAVEESVKLTNTYFSDDFTADAEEGVEYQWNLSSPNGVKLQVADGQMQLITPNKNMNPDGKAGSLFINGYRDRVYLSAVNSEGVDEALSWSNYTAEFDVSMDPLTGGYQDFAIFVMVYADELGQGYGFMTNGRNENSISEFYQTDGAYGKVITYNRAKYPAVAGPVGTRYHVQLKVENVISEDPTANQNRVTAVITSTDAEGNVKTNTQIMTNTKIPYRAGGSIGVYVCSGNASDSSAGYITDLTHVIDNVVVTSNETGEILFADEFSDSRYLEGSTGSWNVDATHDYYDTTFEYRFKQVDFSAHTYNVLVNGGGSVKDGKYWFYTNAPRNAQYMTYVQSKNSNGEYVTPEWDDFTIQTKLAWKQGTGKSDEAGGIFGRVTYNAATGKYSYYCVAVSGNRVSVYRVQDGTSTTLPNASAVNLGTGSEVKVTFATQADNSLNISVQRGTGTVVTYTDASPLAPGSVGVGYRTANSYTNLLDTWVSFDYLTVTSASGEALLDEDFEGTTGIVQTAKTPDYSWYQVEKSENVNAGVASKWSYATTNTNAYVVNFGGLTEGSGSFRMDLQAQVGNTDVRGIMNDYVLQFRSWMGTSATPSDVSSSYSGVAASMPLHSGALLRVQPVYDEDGKVVDYTYYRVRVSQNIIYFEKRYYNPSTGLYEDVVLSSVDTTQRKRPNYGNINDHAEDIWHVFQIAIIGNTVTIVRPTSAADRVDVYKGYTVQQFGEITFTDDGNYGDVYTSGGVSLWAQAENSTAETVDMNVYFDDVKVYNSDMNLVFVDDFENSTYLGETPAPGADSFYLYDNYAYTDDRAYTNQVKELVHEDIWNVVKDADNDVLEKIHDDSELYYLNYGFGETNEAVGWKNYGMNAKFKLVENGYAGIVLFYNGNTGYELRFDGAKASLYKITNDAVAATPMSQIDQTLATGEWITVAAKIVGNTLTYTIGGNTKTLAITDKAPLCAGSVALDASAGVMFDDVLVYSLDAAPTFNVADGRIYCTGQNVTVTDDDLVSFTVNGEEVGDKTVTIKSDGDYTLTATDEEGHVTTVSFTIRNAAHCYVPGISALVRFNEYTHSEYCIYCGTENSDAASHTMQGKSWEPGYLECPSGCEDAFKQVEYNGTKEPHIQKALETAYKAYLKDGVEKEVKLLTNLFIRGLVIPKGVKLDLAGYYLWTKGLDCDGQIVDTGRQVTEGEVTTTVYGGLKAHNADTNIPTMMKNNWMALLDKATGYYRFFEYNYENLGSVEDGEYTKIGVRLTFTNPEAYDLLANNDVQLGFNITWTGLEEPLFYVFKDSTIQKYVDRVKEQLNGTIKATLVLKIRGLDAINGGQPGELVATPIFMSDVNSLVTIDETTIQANQA